MSCSRAFSQASSSLRIVIVEGASSLLFHPLDVAGAMLVESELRVDARGHFARVFCHQEFGERGLELTFSQESVSFNHRAGTIRGFHFQRAPHEEAKLITCVRGSIFDVILDARTDSPTRGRWCSVNLVAGSWTGVYVPPGCAHAYQTLEDETELLYRMSRDYEPTASGGYRWNSPVLGISWPLAETILSASDAALPLFE
jgi:dTDP-4-dehydrorhamnose 3,5-epimerase